MPSASTHQEDSADCVVRNTHEPQVALDNALVELNGSDLEALVVLHKGIEEKGRLVNRYTRESPVEYLAWKKHAERISRQPSVTGFGEHQDALDIYIDELNCMYPEALNTLYHKEKEKDRVARFEELAYQDSRRFFHQPYTDADFSHWSKTAFWTLEEAIALSFGKEPTIVNAESVAPFIEDSLLAQRFAKIADLAIRAVQWKELNKAVAPGVFLAWALKHDITVPNELVGLVQAQGNLEPDWEEKYHRVKEEHDELLEKLHQNESDEAPLPKLAEQSKAWHDLEQKAQLAVTTYPNWRQGQRTVHKSKNLHDWLLKSIGADNREAEFLKKVMSDIFKELN